MRAVRLLALQSSYFIFGLGSCEPRIPVTVNADSVANERTAPEPEDPADRGRLKDCPPGTADCDRNPNDGCESVLVEDAKNCGVCGDECSGAHAESGCLGGTCRIIQCSAGFCDDDGEVANGCEVEEKVCHPLSAQNSESSTK
ncbi:MAG TPA: hypothetical protein VGM44_15250 [Polyangiaceae bacterium]